MVDIHTHILPGVDDGAQDLEEALEMAWIAVECGVESLVCTPHGNLPGMYENYENGQMSEVFLEFRQRLKEEQVPLQVYRGMEIFVTPDVTERMLNNEVVSINGSGYYLVEFAFDESPDFMGEILYEMQELGAKPILAHPERYYCVQDYPGFLNAWVKNGVHIQVNRGSFFGRFGRHAEEAAYAMLHHNMITCIASDAHSPMQRTTFLGDIYRMLCSEYSEEMAKMLLEINPKRVISGKEIERNHIIPF